MANVNVSNLAHRQHMQSLLRSARAEMNRAQVQVTTGLRSTDYSGLGVDASHSIDLRASVKKVDVYISNIDTVTARTDIMDKSLLRITEIARETFNELMEPIQSGQPDLGSLSGLAADALSQIQTLVNTSLGDRFLFAGDEIHTAPIADTAILRTQTQAIIAAFMGDPAQTSADILDPVTGIHGFTDADFGYDPALAGAGPVTARVDDRLDIDYTVKADVPGIRDIMRGLATIAEIQFDPAREGDFWTVYNAAATMMNDGALQMDRNIADLGNGTKVMNESRGLHEDERVIYQGFLSEVEDIDTAEAIMRMQMLQTQLEATYNVMASLRELSLVNYI